jgi:hypothetical protein
MASDDAFSTPVGGGSMGGAVRGGGRAGSGLVGGAVGSAGGVTSSVAPTANGVARDTGAVASTATTDAVGNVHGAATATESLGAHATAIPGVTLAGDASGSASGTLSAANRNVHLDSGSQLVLGVAAAGPR